MCSTFVMRLFGRLALNAAQLARDERGIAATEFAVIVPLMLVMFFGTVEITSAVNVDRKLAIVARTLADLPSQAAIEVTSTDLQNYFTASGAILWPYDPAPIKATVSQIYVDANKIARITWSKSAIITRSGGQTSAGLIISSRNVNDVVALNAALAVPDTFLIWSETSYNYVPAVGYVMGKAGVTLSETYYSRPRQGKCVRFREVVGNYTFGSC